MPFLNYTNKWSILLGVTSNPGFVDIQACKLEPNKALFEHIMQTTQTWASPDNLMYVVGATQTQTFRTIRKILPNHIFLCPGIGKQKGNLYSLAEHAMNTQCGIIVSVSRSLSNGKDFEYAHKQSLSLKQQMKECLRRKQLIPSH